MKRVYIVLELADDSEFDPADDGHQDELAEDLLGIVSKVQTAIVYTSVADFIAEEAEQ